MVAKVRVNMKSNGKAEAFVKNLKGVQADGVKRVDVGFFETARYPERRLPVAAVAVWNDFGTNRIPPRPFFRNSVETMGDTIGGLLRSALDPEKMIVNETLANQIGFEAGKIIQDEIVNLRTPPNAPATIARKKSSNPLIDTGFMHQSVHHQVVK